MGCEMIEVLREKLHKLIMEQADFEEIQKVSQLLDEYLVEYYSDRRREEG